MADSFFGFNTDFPSENILGRHGLNEELLTDDVEEEYDALNDETFGKAENDDWEEAHEKLSELIKRKGSDSHSVFDDSLLEGDESQDEIVSKCISHMGLGDDDLDDPAIMTISRKKPVTRLDPHYGHSPPPPAILETENCGSPKTHSIWSATSKDSGLASLIQSISHNSNSSLHLDTSFPLNSPDSVFHSPLRTAWRAEELERDLLSSSNNAEVQKSYKIWPQTTNSSTNTDKSDQINNLSHLFTNGNVQNQDNKTKMLTREEVERHLHSESRNLPLKNVYPPPPFVPAPILQPRSLIPSIGAMPGNNFTNPLPSAPSPSTIGCAPGQMPGGAYPSDFLKHRYNPAINNIMRNQVPFVPKLCMPKYGDPRFSHYKLPAGFPAYSLAHKHVQCPPIHQNFRFNGQYQNNSIHASEDEYAGLMTQREKEWLVKIQISQLKSDNPHVEDYYYATQVARKCQKKYSETAQNGSKDGPELILPERSKIESKVYVPTQFEGSLGKLQAVSVNFPRKVLDITVARPQEDDEDKVVTNQNLAKYRRLLLDIEAMYTHLLEIDDEEKRILALPDSGAEPHRQTILKLSKKLSSSLSCDNSSADENFQNIMSVRKGRNLVMRVFKIFNEEQKFHCLINILRYLPTILRKDQNDLILLQNCEMILGAIKKYSLPYLVQLGEILINNSLESHVKEKCIVCSAFRNKFGSSVICCILDHAENLYAGYELFEADLQSRWAKIILQLVDCLCSLSNDLIQAPLIECTYLLKHFQRFPVDRDKFELLSPKLSLLEINEKKQEPV